MRVLVLTLFLVLAACDEPMIIANVPAVITDPSKIDEAFPPSIVELGIDSHGARMNGHIYLANGPGPHPTVILLHGFPGNEKNLDLAQAFRRAGWNVLFFHYRGAWGSEGNFTFSGGIEDVASAIKFLRDPANENLRVDPSRIALVGHSMGGFMALQGGARDEQVKCVVTMAAANFGERAVLSKTDPAALEGFKQYSDQLIMLKGFNGETALAELSSADESFDNQSLAPKLAGKKLFLIGAERDQAVDIGVHERHMRAYLDSAIPQMTELRLDADHSFSWHRLRLAHEITDWLNRECR